MAGQDGDFYARHGHPRPTSYALPPVPAPSHVTTQSSGPPTPQVAVPNAPEQVPTPGGGPPWWRRNIAIIVPWTLVVLLAATVVYLLLPSGPTTPTIADDAPTTHDVTVNFLLQDVETAYLGCEGSGGYSDIGPGTPVTIKDESGKILGAGTLGQGSNTNQDWCRWKVTIPDVDTSGEFYSAEVGDRGAITQSADELAANDYTFELSLGS